jgi:hypothetical protein
MTVFDLFARWKLLWYLLQQDMKLGTVARGSLETLLSRRKRKDDTRTLLKNGSDIGFYSIEKGAI